MNASVYSLLHNLPTRILTVIVTILVTVVAPSLVALAKDGTVEPSVSTVNAPPTIYFQGNLVTETGDVYPDGLYTIAFTFYDAATGGGQLWSETQTVQLEHGAFSVRLGDEHPMNLTFDMSRWLEVRAVDHDEIESFRTEFLIPAETLDAR